jgi:NitT/TauT family transport system permease protein
MAACAWCCSAHRLRRAWRSVCHWVDGDHRAVSFVGSVIAEIVAGNNGIGNVMLIAGSNFNVPLVFAALLVVGTMGIGMYAIFAFFERRLTDWSRRGAGGIEYANGG